MSLFPTATITAARQMTPSWFDVHLDNETELRRVLAVLDSGATHLVLICDESGAGKTTFLGHLIEAADDISYAWFDLRDGTHDPHTFAWRLGVDLGLDLDIARLGPPLSTVTVNINNSRLRSSPVSADSVIDAADSRSAALLAAAAELTVGLAVPVERPRLVVLDSYEQASDEFRTWFEITLLPAISRAPMLVLVIAGQDVPMAGRRWHCPVHQTRLLPLEPRHVRELALRAEVSLSEEEASLVVEITAGHPAEVVGALANIVQRRRGIHGTHLGGEIEQLDA